MRRVLILTISALCAGTALETSALGQGASSKRNARQVGGDDAEDSGLEKVRGLFKKLDRDEDSFVSAGEAGRTGIPVKSFFDGDWDGDRQLSPDEFTLWYWHLLVDDGRPVPKDLADEAARVETLRRAREAERRSGPRPTEGPRGSQPPTPAPGVKRIQGEPAPPAKPAVGAKGTLEPAPTKRPAPAPVAATPLEEARGLAARLTSKGALHPETQRDLATLLGDPSKGEDRPSADEVRAAYDRTEARLPGLVIAGHLSAEEARQLKGVLADRLEARSKSGSKDDGKKRKKD